MRTFKRRISGGQLRRSLSGFTLVEVLIVVVIVGILMSIALPSYQESLRKGRRADAKAGLLDAANRQERLMLDLSRYTTDLTELGFANPTMSPEKNYTLTADACAAGTTAPCYTLTATPVTGGAQAGDAKCATFSISSTGQKSATGTQSNICW
jgi:type IV pilus assembly protein PilE